MEVIGNENAVITMIVVFALVIGAAQWCVEPALVSYCWRAEAHETFFYPIYGGIILLSGLIVFCTELILEEIRSLKEDTKEDTKEQSKKHRQLTVCER